MFGFVESLVFNGLGSFMSKTTGCLGRVCRACGFKGFGSLARSAAGVQIFFGL